MVIDNLNALIDKSGYLKIPLFHGTSDFFLDSIKQFGLGGYRDLQLFDWDILQALMAALAIPENHCPAYEEQKWILEKMLRSRESARPNYWSYGDVYLSPSENTAINYATRNEVCSEFLSSVKFAYDHLIATNVEAARKIISQSHALDAVFSHEHRPILIQVDSVHVDSLAAENGADAMAQLEDMGYAWDNWPDEDKSLLINGVLQQHNFRLQKPAGVAQLKVYCLNENHEKSLCNLRVSPSALP